MWHLMGSPDPVHPAAAGRDGAVPFVCKGPGPASSETQGGGPPPPALLVA